MVASYHLSLNQLLLSTTFFFHAFALPAANAPRAASPTVTIASGTIIGITSQPTGLPSYANAYLGVPFAKSPPERFSPPQAAPAWNTPLVAQAFKPACIQQFTDSGNAQILQKQIFGNPTGGLTPESEDCLYLNVFTPPNVTPSSKKSVMFWLFPGNLQFGTASLPIYDGSTLAVAQDVVVVTINYRTNIFGFSNSPEIPTGSQNAGYLDQRFALQWVQNNIANFGGDPSKVTIFGESAGGESVKQLLANPPSPLPFSAAIMESQQSMLIGSGADSYNKVLKNFNCKDLDCLRNVPATDIKSYIESTALVFPPVNGDGTSVANVQDSIRTKKWAKVPVLMGTTLNEARAFLAVDGLNDGSGAVDAALAKVGINSAVTKATIFAQYALKGLSDMYVVADRIMTDAIFTCTTSTLSSFLAKNGYAVYRYRYDAVYPSTSIFKNAGSYHTSEIPSVFGTYPVYGSPSGQQAALSSYMQNLWATFAAKSSGNLGWDKVGSTLMGGRELALLGAGNPAGVSPTSPATADYPCVLYNGLADAMGFSW